MNNIKATLGMCLSTFLILIVTGCTSSQKAEPKLHTVEIKQMQFQPGELEVNKGDTIVFINKDIVAHDITEANKKWASPELSFEDSWRLVATQNVDYFCSIHVVMKGKIIVKWVFIK